MKAVDYLIKDAADALARLVSMPQVDLMRIRDINTIRVCAGRASEEDVDFRQRVIDEAREKTQRFDENGIEVLVERHEIENALRAILDFG